VLELSPIFTFTSSNSLKKGGATSDLTKINIRSLQLSIYLLYSSSPSIKIEKTVLFV